MKELFKKNGYLVQGCFESVHAQKCMSYNGVGRCVSWPLFYENDSLSKIITQEAEEKWIENSEISAINDEEFIKKYLKVCAEKNIQTKVLLIESKTCYPMIELDYIDSKFLGYDYSQGDYHFSLLIDDFLMSKTVSILEFDKIFKKLNDNMLFETIEDITEYVSIREKLKLQNKYDFEFDYCAQIIKISCVNI